MSTSTDTQQAEPEVKVFDLAAFADGDVSALPTRSVTVFMRPDLQGRIEADEAALERLQDGPDYDPAPKPGTPQHALAQRIEAAKAQMRASQVTFTFRSAAHQDELADAVKDIPEDDKDAREMARMALLLVSVEPQPSEPITAERFAAIRDKIGPAYFSEVYSTAVTAATAGEVSVPFSLAASLITQDSDES